MEHPYLKPLPANPTAKTGEAGRKAQREKKELSAMRRVDQLLKTGLPELLQQPPAQVPDVRIQAFANKLFDELATKGQPLYAINAGWNRFCDFLDAGNREQAWAYSAIPRLHQLPVQTLLRTARWQKNSSLLHDIDQQLITAIEQAGSSVLESGPVLIGLALYFAATESGICSTKSLTALAHAIVNDEPVYLDKSTGHVWIRLTISDATVTNICLDDNWVRLERPLLDPITICLIRRFRKSDRRLPTKEIDGNKVIRWINEATESLGVKCERLTSLKQLGSVALSIAEQHTDIPQAIYEAAMGNVSNVVMPEWHWRAVNSRRLPRTSDYGPSITKSEGDKSGTPSTHNSTKRHIGIDGVCSALQDSIRLPSGTKTSARMKNEAVKKLRALDTTQWPIAGRMLHAWYLHHLDQRNNELKTVNTYHGTIGPGLLDAMRDLDAYDADDLDEAYRRVIADRDSDKAMIYAARRLTDLHTFSQGEFGLPTLYEPLVSGTTDCRHVRAAYISEDVYRRGYQAIQNLTYRDSHYKERLSVLWIVAYRTGLRRNDLLRLQLRDIEKGKSLNLKVRNNRLGSGKTDNARRVIPLAVLLTAEEHRVVSRFIQKQRKQNVDNESAALFDVEGSPKEKIDPKHVTNDVVTILDRIGHPGVLHDFRHTTLSRLFLIAEREWDLIERYSGYSRKKAEAIYTAVFDSLYVRHERYRALAAFAGHASPAITFDYYIHFSSLVLHTRLRRSTRGFSTEFLSRVIGIGKTRIKKVTRATDVPTAYITLETIRDLALQEASGILTVVPTVESPAATAMPIEAISESPSTLWTMFSALSHWQRGNDPATIAYDHGLSESALKRYVDNGKRLACEQTRKNESRLIARNRKVHKRPLIAPSVPTSPLLTMDARRIRRGFVKKYKGEGDDNPEKARREMEWAVTYWLTHTTTTEAYAIFTEPNELRRFLRVCNGIIHDGRWRLEIPLHEGSDLDVAQQAWRLNKDIVIARLSTRGGTEADFARLYLKHPNDREIIAKMQHTFDTSALDTRQLIVQKYSAHTLRFVFHMMGISMFSTERLAAALDAARSSHLTPRPKAVGG